MNPARSVVCRSWTVLATTGLAIIVFALFTGGSLSPARIWAGLNGQDALASTILLELRIPRILTAFTVGALLALAGSLMQVLLRNPLADPYVLGVSGGASLAALLLLMAGLGGLWLVGGAFAGGLAVMILVFSLGGRGCADPHQLLLTGVVLAAGMGAGISLILALAPPGQLPGMVFWLLGDLSSGSGHWLAGLAVLATGLLISLWLARPLNLMLRGSERAAMLGADPQSLQRHTYWIASLLTATAVSLAGNIGFVGLIIPHAVRLLSGSDHRQLLPQAAAAGGFFLVLADTLSRWLLAPMTLPVGIFTALTGVPVFLYLLHRRART